MSYVSTPSPPRPPRVRNYICILAINLVIITSFTKNGPPIIKSYHLRSLAMGFRQKTQKLEHIDN